MKNPKRRNFSSFPKTTMGPAMKFLLQKVGHFARAYPGVRFWVSATRMKQWRLPWPVVERLGKHGWCTVVQSFDLLGVKQAELRLTDLGRAQLLAWDVEFEARRAQIEEQARKAGV